MVQSAARWLKFDVASQAVTSGRDRDDDHQTARSVVENVDRHHHRRAAKGWLVSDWLAEIDVVDLPPARSSQCIPLVTLCQILLPQFGVIAQALVIPVEPPQEFLPFQGVDGCVHDVDDGGLTSLG